MGNIDCLVLRVGIVDLLKHHVFPMVLLASCSSPCFLWHCAVPTVFVFSIASRGSNYIIDYR
ncbi:MAG TPA: hypothetical protein VFD15_05100, partial [Clostridia bacterium]|nr:hypothetical protein [Clostridia bacterium]